MRRSPVAVFDDALEAQRRSAPVLGSKLGTRWKDPLHHKHEFTGPQVPGPGSYDVTRWRTDHTPAYSFGGKGVRTKADVAKRAERAPGPADYNPSLKFVSTGLSF